MYTGGLKVEQVHSIILNIKNNNEKQLKAQLKILTGNGIITKESNSKLCNVIEQFMSKDYVYYANGNFMNDELDDLSSIAIQSAHVLNDYRFKQYKQLLEEQLARDRKFQ